MLFLKCNFVLVGTLLSWGKRLRKNKSSFSGWRFLIASSQNFAFWFSIAMIVSLYLAFTPFRFLFCGLTCTNDLSWLLTSPSSWFSSCVPYCVNLRSLSFLLKATESQSQSDGLPEWGYHSGKPSDCDCLHRPAGAYHHYTHLHILCADWHRLNLNLPALYAYPVVCVLELTLGFWEEQIEDRFERTRPHVSCLRQLSASPLE
jgi:hypothetical protein